MKARIAAMVGEKTARYLWMGTFHSVFSRILRAEADKTDFSKNFSIYDSSDSNSLIKSIVKDLKLGHIIMTEKGPEKVISIKETSEKVPMFDLSVTSQNHRYYTNGILSHNTTIGAYYLLYEACFPASKGDILIVAHKQAHSMEVLKRLKDMYYSMPLWLKPGMVKNNETSIEFDNGMRIIAEATTSNAARGKSLKFVYCVSGDTKIQIRNKNTGEVREIDIQDLYFNNEYK
jgi:hypothetical protein